MTSDAVLAACLLPSASCRLDRDSVPQIKVVPTEFFAQGLQQRWGQPGRTGGSVFRNLLFSLGPGNGGADGGVRQNELQGDGNRLEATALTQFQVAIHLGKHILQA